MSSTEIGKGPIDLSLLRQIGDAASRTFDAAFDPRRQAEHRLQERALAGAVGPDDGGIISAAGISTDSVMHRRMAIVAHGQVDQAESGVHLEPQDSAHQAHSHSRPDTPSAAATRAGALMASRKVPGEMGPCMGGILL